MNATNQHDRHVMIATTIKPCPFCSSRGVITQADDPPKFGVRCIGCPACLPETLQSSSEAMAAWCCRRGTAAAAGGRGTRGVSTWKKRRSSRRNMRIARRKKKLKWMKAHVKVTLKWLKMFTSTELADMEALVAKDRAELALLEPIIRKYPQASELYDWILARRARAEDGHK